MLKIENLRAKVGGQEILRGINLEIKQGEVHAIMGPNGSGKSTLTKILMGHPDYEILEGTITYQVNRKKINLAELETEDRAKEGIFLGFQYPVEIPGVNNLTFLRESFNQICEHQGTATLDPFEFKEFLQPKLELLDLDESFLNRPTNEGFSGGEKKKNEILQLLTLNPRLALLDETDSGLDIDSLQIVSKGINKIKSRYNAILLVTHYQRLLNYVVPDFIHIMQDGKIIKTGDKNLAHELENKGYEWLKDEDPGQQLQGLQ